LILGKPFFVTKERFPQAPSKKVILDLSWAFLIRLNASEAIEKAGNKSCSLLFSVSLAHKMIK